jgi:outer membrane protein
MNKNILLGLNIFLLAAVGFLYYKTFSNGGSKKGSATGSYTTTAKDSNCNRAHIAYVELDSMYEHITYIKQKRTDMEAKQKRIESDWQSGMRGLEAKRDNFMKKGASITQQEAEKFQGQLISEQQAIEGRKQRDAQALSNESFDFTEGLQKELKAFLEEYNKEKKYMYILTTGTGLDYLVYKNPTLNITDDVIKGMNEKMKGKLGVK